MKNKHLYQYHIQLEQLKGNIIYELLGGRIRDFYKNNRVKLQSIIDKLHHLQEEFFVIENDKVKMTPLEVTDNVRKEPEPVMLEGKTFKEYEVKYNELMEKDCIIKF